MGYLRLKARHFSRRLVCVALVCAPFLARGQSITSSEGATVYGTVRDAHGQPVAAASVHIQLQGTDQIVSAVTDATGAYRCAGLHEGVYSIRAERAGSDAIFGPVALRQKQASEVNLTLPAHQDGQSSTAKPPEFYDEPQFTVAGVTDASNHGGHGSDVIFRTSQSLARDVVSIDRASASAPPEENEASLREAVQRAPQSFEANQQLGAFLARAGRPHEAVPYLEQSHQIRPDDYDSAFDLAQAYTEVGEYERGAAIAQRLLTRQDRAAVHHLLGDLEEKRKQPIEAVNEYQRAAELDASESNYFDWGAELLTHRALQPAIAVFTKGHRLFPQSARMLVGLGVAWYATGASDLAMKYVCDASDLNPVDGSAYLVLGKMQIGQPSPPEAVLSRMERFARLQPNNALANYYYAVALWKHGKSSANSQDAGQIQVLLEKSVRLDPKLARGYLQLGILSEERSDLAKAVSAYRMAIGADSQLEEAHYRLAQLYRRTGEKTKAEEEIRLYDGISRKTALQSEQEGREIPQFVYTLRDPKSTAQPH